MLSFKVFMKIMIQYSFKITYMTCDLRVKIATHHPQITLHQHPYIDYIIYIIVNLS